MICPLRRLRSCHDGHPLAPPQFTLFDKAGKGEIPTDQLGDVLRQMGQDPSEEELEEMIKEVDADGDGSVDVDEFADSA